MKTKMTVTRALTKLKTLDSKINKAIQGGCFVTYKVGDKVDTECNSKENLQSVMDLINFRDRLKAAIAKSNAVTKVKVAGKEMTVVEAIEAKSSIQYRERLLLQMRHDLQRVRQKVESINQDAQYRLDRLIEASVGSDKGSKSDTEAITKTFMARNEAEVFDSGLEIDKVIENLDKELSDFIDDIDVSLSEINSKTEIEI